jgi:hypothetical protein
VQADILLEQARVSAIVFMKTRIWRCVPRIAYGTTAPTKLFAFQGLKAFHAMFCPPAFVACLFIEFWNRKQKGE